MKSLILVVLGLSTIQLEAQVLVKLKASKSCGGLAEVILAREKLALFHIQLPSGGNAEFKLVPGKFELNALTKSNCSAIKKFDFEGKQKTVTIQLSKQNTKQTTKQTIRKTASTSELASSGFLGPGSLFASTSIYQPWGMPFWYPYYYPSYPNINYPCAYTYYGCMSPQYPQGGPIVLGKPNIYISGLIKNLKVNFAPAAMKGLMASAPAHMEKGWTVEVSDKGIKHNGTIYPYLYYDLRGSAENMQLSRGYCGEKAEVLPQMEKTLKQLTFPEEALEDFRNHWGVHFPSGRSFCILPQASEELSAVAPIEFSTEVNFTRMVFVVFPEKVASNEPPLDSAFDKYRPGHLKKWEAKAEKAPTENSVNAFEWGLAFAFIN